MMQNQDGEVMQNNDYAAGLRQGEINALKEITAKHHDRLDGHSKRMSAIEKLMYGLIGIVAFVEIYPNVRGLWQ